ncbi:MAG: LysM peptidoglycan-binding domain-containing protein, partial [Chloroflexota bacterium]
MQNPTKYWAVSLLVLLLAVVPAAGFAQDDASEEEGNITETLETLSVDATLETYTVQSGDNLYRIALRFNTTVGAIATENGIADVTQVFVGQVLRIPGTVAADSGGDDTGADSSGDDASDDVGTGGPAQQGGTTYTVVRGDTLGSIARQFGTTFTEIAAANNLADPNLIFPGQQLVIPGATVVDSGASDGGTTSTPTTDSSAGGTYTVQSGDTLNSIARRFNTTFTAIAQANGITNVNLIFPGQQLTIPGATIVDSGTTDGGSTAPPTTGGGATITGGFELGGQVISFSQPD